MSTPNRPVVEKPQNGLAGLRHWRHDLLAGLVVSLVSLPLSSGIAIASGAPPIYGIISSIIAGLIFPFVGGSYVTISGPAAGLAPALLATMAALGGAGDAEHVGAGYPLLLVVIFTVGVVQLVMARLKLARFAAIFPASVVEGMLGAIGVLILIKALPLFLGYLEPVHAHHFGEYLGEIPVWLAGAEPGAVVVGVVSLTVMFAVASPIGQRFALLRTVPPHLFAVVIGGGLAAALGLGAEFRIAVPANPLSGIQLPDFQGMLSRSELWGAAAMGVVTLTLIDGVESLATAQAIDRIDPFKRRSQPNRLLAAMGASNLLSSLVGGLTIIPGGVKSKTCIEGGGRTLWANFANAAFLLGFLFVAPALVALIPKATLGAILVFTGWRMMHPSIARHMAEIGREQVFLYAVTILITLFTDLLVGVLAGTGLKLVILMLYARPAGLPPAASASFRGTLADMFRDPVTEVVGEADRRTYRVTRPLVCFNAYKLLERLDASQAAPSGPRVEDLTIEIAPGVPVVDHTAIEGVFLSMDAATRQPLRVVGLEPMVPLGNHRSAVRVQPRTAGPPSGILLD
jgi:carbonic anhydrase